MIVFVKNGQTQQVEERERKRIEILERSGWQRSDVDPVVVDRTGEDGYSDRKTEGDIARIAAEQRQAKRRKVAAKPQPVNTAQRDITGMQTGALPEDFPSYEALRDAGIGTYEALREAGDVTAIRGVGQVSAAKINDALRKS